MVRLGVVGRGADGFWFARMVGVTLCATVALVVAGTSHAAVRATAASDGRAGVSRSFVLYTVPVAQQFVNTADNRSRGAGSNPFGNFRGTGLATTTEHVGPRPGDTGYFTAHLYTSAAVKKKVGDVVFACNYVFGRDGLCDVQFSLAGGTLVGTGFYTPLATHQFPLVVTGGTGAYRGFKGSVEAFSDNVVPTVAQIQIVSHDVPSLQLSSQRLVFTLHRAPAVPAPGGHAPRALTLYSLATSETFMDHADDETRGWQYNPFGLRDRAQQFAESEDKGGPYPGDAAFFTFGLYTSPGLRGRTRVGTAQFVCFYYFGQNGVCESTYLIGHDTLNGLGAFSFHATTFPLAITGGTSAYAGMTGEVEVSPGGTGSQAANEQRLRFSLE